MPGVGQNTDSWRFVHAWIPRVLRCPTHRTVARQICDDATLKSQWEADRQARQHGAVCIGSTYRPAFRPSSAFGSSLFFPPGRTTETFFAKGKTARAQRTHSPTRSQSCTKHAT